MVRTTLGEAEQCGEATSRSSGRENVVRETKTERGNAVWLSGGVR